MIVQQITDTVQYIYTKNANKDYMTIAKALGLCEGTVLKSYVIASHTEFENAYGSVVKAVIIHGYGDTEYYVIDDSVTLDIKSSDVSDDSTFRAILDGLNFFPKSRLIISENTYIGPFSFANGSSKNTIMDSSGKHIMLTCKRLRDVKAINEMLARLNYDNGKYYEPMINRYFSITEQMRDTRIMPIGYFNFHEYLRIIKSKANLVFGPLAKKKTKPTILLESDGNPGYVKVISSSNGFTNLALSENIKSIDLNKTSTYDPFVIISRRPFNIAGTKFPWQFVKYGNTTLCMSPIICPEKSLQILRYSINLLND
jgi:hypothetical protein